MDPEAVRLVLLFAGILVAVFAVQVTFVLVLGRLTAKSNAACKFPPSEEEVKKAQ